MKRAAWWLTTGILALACGSGALAATPEARAAYKATTKKATAEYNAARSHCRTLSGHERAVCIAEAKGALSKAEADATATYRDSERARKDARVTAAKADYLVDKAKCGDRSGEARKACLKDARQKQSEAIRSALAAEREPTAAAAARAPAVPHTRTP